MRGFLLKESDVTEKETLKHCLTVIQAFLDDDFNKAYKYLYDYLIMAIKQEKKQEYQDGFDFCKKMYHIE